jgi:hypothetical protein
VTILRDAARLSYADVIDGRRINDDFRHFYISQPFVTERAKPPSVLKSRLKTPSGWRPQNLDYTYSLRLLSKKNPMRV